LTNGRAKSCGCINTPNLVGKRFGRLVVLEKTDKYSGTSVKWLCQCDCGGTHEAPTNHLRRGHIKSCGCLNSTDLAGKTFGMLTVMTDTGERDSVRRKIWLCKCECGNDFKVRTDSLTTGNTTSCGCLTGSKGEKRIIEYLDNHGVNYKQEYTFPDLKNVRPLRFDFGILDEDDNLIRLIEFDGRQHENITGYFGGIEEFELYQQRDELKNNYCKENNIPLLRISHSDYDNIESILDCMV